MKSFLRTAATAGLLLATSLVAQNHAEAQVYDQCLNYRPAWGYGKCLRYTDIRYERCRAAGHTRLRCNRERRANVASCRQTWCRLSAPVRRP